MESNQDLRKDSNVVSTYISYNSSNSLNNNNSCDDFIKDKSMIPLDEILPNDSQMALPPKKVRNAVEVRDVDLTYGFGIKTNVVLTGMNITVPEGGIYALIGPSGCGKTSILRCIMGFINPDSGRIKVFGKKPAAPRSFVPGKDLGYMPQDVALNNGLTVHEMMRYFGKIFLLPPSEVEERIDRLIDILGIPEKNRVISTLSGGQRRRVSFACAVIHKPRLSILDEPTVGVDPLIREKIWDYLLEMTKEGKTIILTTHYIEETRRADVIGFLRKGYLLAEEHPTRILEELQVWSPMFKIPIFPPE